MTDLPRKHYKPEEIIAKLRQVDVLVSQGQSMADAIRQIGVSEVTCYQWRQDFGVLAKSQFWPIRKRDPNQRVWTDDYSNVFGAILRRLLENNAISSE
jgi:transposase-like protein